MPIHRPGQTVRETPTHVLRLPLCLGPWQAAEVDKTFEASRLLYNSLVHRFKRQYRLYQHTRQYKISTAVLADKKSSKKAKSKARAILKQTQEEYGFTRPAFEAASSELCGGWLKDRLYSMVRQKVAADCWKAFSTLLGGKGKEVKYKGFHDREATLQNKWNQGPFRYDSGYFIIGKLTIPVEFPKHDPYVEACMAHRVKYCGLSRYEIRGKTRYQLLLYLEGFAPVKVTRDGELKHPIAPGEEVGIDIGTQTIALSSRNGVWAGVLASELGDVQALENKINRLNRAMDRSRRATNPWAFREDGQVIPAEELPSEHRNRYGRHDWHESNHYAAMKARRKELYRKQAAIRRQSHWLLVQRIVSLGTVIHVEKMNFNALAKRAKQTKKSARTGRCLSKKRFGHSIANRAPAMLIEMLGNKVAALGGTLYKSNPWEIKASQVDHQTREYTKKSLSQRFHYLKDGTAIQRDYYSAFIEQHVDEENNTVNFEACARDFPDFYKMYQADYARLAALNGYLPTSMGIK